MAKAKKPSGPLTEQEARVLVYLLLNPACTVSEVRANAPQRNALAVLRTLKARRYVRQSKRLWSVARSVAELMAMGSRLQREGLNAFRASTPEAA
jgi:DNA-binding MarR family transcriptional regulator